MIKSEKELIPLAFRMYFNLERKYERLDTHNLIDEKDVHILIPGLKVNNIPYNGVGKIKIKHALRNANGLILRISGDLSKEDLKKDALYSWKYCHINERALQKQARESELGSGLLAEY